MTDAISLDGQAAIVTGASKGIGRETALALAEAGADVALAARSEDELEDLANTIRSDHDGRALVVPTDVRDESAVTELIEPNPSRSSAPIDPAGSTTPASPADRISRPCRPRTTER